MYKNICENISIECRNKICNEFLQCNDQRIKSSILKWTNCIYGKGHANNIHKKIIKSYLEGNGYEIWSRWLSNTPPWMSSVLWRKMVSLCLLSSQSLVNSKQSLSISNIGNFMFTNSIELATLLVSHVGGFKFQETHLDMVRLGLSLVDDNICTIRLALIQCISFKKEFH
jgi:hypothetical protein